MQKHGFVTEWMQ